MKAVRAPVQDAFQNATRTCTLAPVASIMGVMTERRMQAAHQAQHTNCMCMVLASWSGGKSFFLSKRSRTRGGRMRKVEAARIPVTDVHLKSVSAESVGRKSMPRRALIRAITNGRRGRGMNISKNTSHSRRYHVSATSFACLRAPGQVPRAGLLQQASGIVS